MVLAHTVSSTQEDDQVRTLIALFTEEMTANFSGFTDETLFSTYDNVKRLEVVVPNAIAFPLDHDLTQMVIRAIERGANITHSSPSG